MGYVESRRKVYIPCYQALIRKEPVFWKLVERIRSGLTVMLLDMDAPDVPTLISKEFLEEIVVQDSPFGKPFGHGYSLAAAILEDLTGEKINLEL